MLKLLFAFVLVTGVVYAQKLSMDQRRQQIIHIVDEELAEVTRLAKQQNYKSPDTLLRVSELNLEKARIWREVENERYLSIPPEERRNVKKNSFFKRSTKYFQAANESAQVVVKRFQNYRGIGDVYYILAYNNKELGNNKDAQKYFELATKKAAPNTAVSYKSKLALAEYYYNAGSYKKAIPLYENSINKINDRWWTKDSFNLAWCYYRVKNYDKAINLMREIHRKSGDNKYIDMKSMVERDLGVFYVDAGRMNDAIKFYESNGLNYTDQFVKVANAITSQGRFSQAETLLNQAAKNEKNREKRVEILMAQLDLFDKFNKVSEHLKVSQELVQMHKQAPLAEDHLKRVIYHVDKKAAELQKSTTSDLYKNVKKVRNQKSTDAIAYFELSSQLSPGEKAEKTFFQGETAYAAGNYTKALNLYIQSFDAAKAKGETKIQSQSIEGMLASLGQPSLNPKTAEKFYLPVYSRYLSFDSKTERAKSIYVKLFNTQFDAKDMNGAEKTLEDFASKFPGDYKTQEGMLAKVMEHYRSKKDYGKVKAYVSDINSGKYKVSKKYADALRSLMTKIQIEGVQQSLEKGQKDVALKGYHQIFENAESTPKAKTNAAYNLSALYYEIGDSQQSYEWATTALKSMDTADVSKFSDSFLSISSGLFLKQYFSQSADLSLRVLAKLCKENSSNKAVAYKNAAFIALANNELDKALEIKDFGKSCMIPDVTITEVTLELIKELAAAKRWESYETQLTELERNSKNYPQLIRPYEELRKVYISLGDVKRAQDIEAKQNKYYNQAKTQKLEIPVEALDLIAERLLSGVVSKKQQLDQVVLRFPENEFNNAVKAKLQLLDQMTSQVNNIQKTGSGKGIVEAYKYVIGSYEEFAESLRGFVPEGKSPEYVASFSKAMSEVYNPILVNARKQRNEVKKLIMDNKILTVSNYSVLYSSQENFKRYLTVKEAILMDRGGKR